MPPKVRATAFRATVGNNYIPLNGDCYPSVEDELIAKEEAEAEEQAEMIRVQQTVHRYQNTIAPLVKAIVAKAEKKQQTSQALCNPDICHCGGQKKYCHLNVSSGTHGHSGHLARKPTHYCPTCITAN